MKKWFIILFFSRSCFAQFTDTVANISPVNLEIIKQKKPEILTNGFVDLMNSGQMNASARLFKLYLGEPEKFVVPISLYIGVTGNNLAPPPRSNEPLLLNIVNPLSGIMNISVDGTHFLWKKGEPLTNLGLLYQAGGRLLSYNNMISFQTVTFMNGFANAGLLFRTGAWEKNKTDNMGIFQTSFKVLVIGTNTLIEEFLNISDDENKLWAWSIGFGLEINKVVSIKTFYYRYLGLNNDLSKIPVYQLSFNYFMR